MSDQAAVRLFGKLLVTVNGFPIRIRTKPAQNLMALLCTKPGEPLNRTRIAESVWNDLPFSTTSNRLRTTLIILKKALEPWEPLHGDRHSIWIDTDLQGIDLAIAASHSKRVQVLQDLDQELEALQDLLAIIDQPFLADLDDPWIDPIRQSWIDQRTASLLRVAQIQDDLGNLAEGLAAVEKVFEQDPYNSQSWIRYLRSMAQIGRGEEGIQRLHEQQEEMIQDLGVGFDSDVHAMSSQIHHGAIQPKKGQLRFSTNERKVLVATLEHMATNSPDEFLTLVASKSFVASTFLKPSSAFNIVLESLSSATSENDPEIRAQALRAGIISSINLGDLQEREAIVKRLIDEYPKDSIHHIYGLAQLSFLKFEQRDMEAAYALANEAKEIADAQELLPYQRLMKTNLASFDWQFGRDKEAEAAYLQLYEEYKDQEGVMIRYSFIVICINLAFVMANRLDWAACHAYCQEGWRNAVISDLAPLRSTAEPLFGLSKVILGLPEGPKLIVEGLKSGYRMRHTRMVEIGVDHAAGALILLGEPETGLAILDAITPIRGARLHFRSVAEQALADWLRDKAGDAKPNGVCAEDDTLLSVVMTACDAIENLA